MTASRPDLPELRGDGLVLRAWTAEDAAGVLAIADDEASRIWSPSLRQVRTEDQALAWITSREADSDRMNWAVRDARTGELVGRVGLHRFDRDLQTAEIGYGVHPSHRRRGVARRAVGVVAAHGFGPLGLARLSLLHAVGNEASCWVATRAGFGFEGVERSAWPEDGERLDVHRHARLPGDPRPAEPVTVPGPGIEPVEIAAGRVQLRPTSVAEAPDALAMLADPDVARWNPGPERLDLAAAQEWCRRAGDWSDGSHATFSVLDVTSGRLLGNVSLHKIDRAQQDAEVGYRVAPWARGQGVATAALSAATGWAFAALDLLRVELVHSVANPASCRVADKAGYPLEGTLRQSYLYGDGSRHDEHLHARLASD